MLSQCLNAPSSNDIPDLPFWYGYVMPSSGTIKGVIVYFDGGNGEDPVLEGPEFSMLQYYVTQGYGVLQVEWSSPWESTHSGSISASIQNGACRPATFLDFVYNNPNLYQLALNGNGTNGTIPPNSNAGMCAQGFSAGSGAIAYSLAYYGAVLDNVELISGPELSDIKQGCQVPGPPGLVLVCPTGQLGCNLGTGSSWAVSPQFLSFDQGYARAWTNDSSCAGSIATSASSNTSWLSQSIVDQSTGGTGQGAVPTFNYPNTAMTGWLCRSVVNTTPAIDCSTSYDYQYCPNNSSSQGEIFYNQITSLSQTAHYSVYAVDSCIGPEGAPQGTVVVMGQSMSGQVAIEQDMAGPPTAAHGQCVHGPHAP